MSSCVVATTRISPSRVTSLRTLWATAFASRRCRMPVNSSHMMGLGFGAPSAAPIDRASSVRNRSPSDRSANRRTHSRGSPNPHAVNTRNAVASGRRGAIASTIALPPGNRPRPTQATSPSLSATASSTELFPLPDGPVSSTIDRGSSRNRRSSTIATGRSLGGIPKSQQTSRIRGDISTQAGSRMTLIRSSLVGLLRSMVFHPETPNKIRTHAIYRVYC